MNQWNLTVRQTLFASFYHTRVGHTEVLTRFTSPIDPRYVKHSGLCSVFTHPYRTSHFQFGIRQGTNPITYVYATSAHRDRTFEPDRPLSSLSPFVSLLLEKRGWHTMDATGARVMVVVSAVAQDAVSTCAAASPVPPLDENQAKQLVSSSTLTKFSFGRRSIRKGIKGEG